VKIIKGYKAFNSDMTCRGVKYEVGHIFYEDCAELVPCQSGIHFCPILKDCYSYYPKNYETIICEVETTGRPYVYAKVTEEIMKAQLDAITYGTSAVEVRHVPREELFK